MKYPGLFFEDRVLPERGTVNDRKNFEHLLAECHQLQHCCSSTNYDFDVVSRRSSSRRLLKLWRQLFFLRCGLLFFLGSSFGKKRKHILFFRFLARCNAVRATQVVQHLIHSEYTWSRHYEGYRVFILNILIFIFFFSFFLFGHFSTPLSSPLPTLLLCFKWSTSPCTAVV
ncbi:hypothetical protein ANCCAN_20002 [Ancylostoma caninum]|uniref:Transmembrane protein n=1 Tax=Ancylostoma caninum TaxID=29170 RepID=A0A368FTP3_ANCCA|nr:hypothetical protein ANCCAN_20002 [Ancylostoma caninum]